MTTCVAIRHLAFEDAGLIEGLLAARGVRLSYVDAGVDPFDAAALLETDLLVVLGGPIGVYETEAYPFLTDEIDILRRRLAARKPMLGICLGAQLIAAALGARVAPGPAKEIGYAPIELTTEGRQSALAPFADVDVLHWHGDNLDLPPGATRLASTKACPNQAFAIGPRVLGLQFHIETDPHSLERWLIGHACELAQAKISPTLLREQAARTGQATAAAGRRALDGWLAGAMS